MILVVTFVKKIPSLTLVEVNCSFVVETSISYGRKSFEMSLRPQLRMVGRKDKYFPKFQWIECFRNLWKLWVYIWLNRSLQLPHRWTQTLEPGLPVHNNFPVVNNRHGLGIKCHGGWVVRNTFIRYVIPMTLNILLQILTFLRFYLYN